jgi:hypothetical protein
MIADAAFYTLLSGTSGVTALVNTRIYPDVLPEKCAYPAIVFAERALPFRALDGTKLGDDVTLTVGCWAETRADADAVAAATLAACATSSFSVDDGPEAGADPETGLLVAILTVEIFVST